MLKRVKFSTKKIAAILVPVMFIIAILAASGIANAAVIVKYNADELHEGDIVSPGLFLDLGSRQEVNYNFVGKDSGTFSEGTILIPDCGEVASKWMVSSSTQMSGDQTKWNITFVPVYKIKIANYEVTYNNKDDILGDGSISYNPTTNTLTMDNADFQINAIASSIDYFGTETLNIVLVGDNTSFTTGPQYGISSTAGINISGEGSLELYSDFDSIHIEDGNLNVTDATLKVHNYIDVAGKLTMSNASIDSTRVVVIGEDAIIAEGSTLTISYDSDVSDLDVDGKLTVSGGEITITNELGNCIWAYAIDVIDGKVTCVADSNGSSSGANGISAYNMIRILNGEVDTKGSYYGISSINEDVFISGGTVKAYGTRAAIHAKNVGVWGGTTTATSVKDGIVADVNIKIVDGIVDAKCLMAMNTQHRALAAKNIMISGGKVTAEIPDENKSAIVADEAIDLTNGSTITTPLLGSVVTVEGKKVVVDGNSTQAKKVVIQGGLGTTSSETTTINHYNEIPHYETTEATVYKVNGVVSTKAKYDEMVATANPLLVKNTSEETSEYELINTIVTLQSSTTTFVGVEYTNNYVPVDDPDDLINNGYIAVGHAIYKYNQDDYYNKDLYYKRVHTVTYSVSLTEQETSVQESTQTSTQTNAQTEANVQVSTQTAVNSQTATNPQTGDNSLYVALIIMSLSSAIVFVYCNRKSKKLV